MSPVSFFFVIRERGIILCNCIYIPKAAWCQFSHVSKLLYNSPFLWQFFSLVSHQELLGKAGVVPAPLITKRWTMLDTPCINSPMPRPPASRSTPAPRPVVIGATS